MVGLVGYLSPERPSCSVVAGEDVRKEEDNKFSLGSPRNGVLPDCVTAGRWGKSDWVIGRMQGLCSPGGSCVLQNDNRPKAVCVHSDLVLSGLFPTHT